MSSSTLKEKKNGLNEDAEIKFNLPIHKNFKMFPLENYDEKILTDSSPSILLNMGSIRGFSKWVDSLGTESWKECMILDYNEKEDEFLIQWLSSNALKKVKRLNLIYQNENEQDFKNRVRIAKMKRDQWIYLDEVDRI